MKWPERIPHLSGPVLLAYRVVWIAAFVIALLGAFLNTPDYLRYRASEKVLATAGVVWSAYVPAGVEIRPISEQAMRAGVVDRDLVLKVDGHSALPDVFGLASQVKGVDGTPVVLTLRNPEGRTRAVTLTRSGRYLGQRFAGTGISHSEVTWITAFARLLAQLMVLGAAAMLFMRRASEPVAAMLALGFLMEVIEPIVFVAPVPMSLGLLRAVIGDLCIGLGVLFFPDGRFAPRWWPAGFAAALFMTFVDVTGWVRGAPVPGTFFIDATATLIVLAVCVSRYFTTPPGIARQQMKFAVLGIAGFGLMLIVGNSFGHLAAVGWVDRRSEWLAFLGNALTPLSWVLLIGGLLISLLRHRLYDADAAISRSVSIGALTVVLLAVFAGSEKVIELLGEEYFGHSIGVFAGGIGAALAAVLLVPLHHRVSGWAERRFQKQLIKLRHGLPLLLGDLRETAPVSRIATAVLDATVHGVRASRAALLVGEQVVGARKVTPHEVDEWRLGWLPSPEPGPDLMRGDALFPLRLPLEADGHGRVGWLLLGPRPDGSFYGKDERATLAEIADPVARALEIAAAREALQAAEAERWQRQDTLNDTLVQALRSIDLKLDRLLPTPGLAAE